MRSVTLPGLARPVSRIALGTAQITLSGADLPASAWFRLWDDAAEAGIDAFDGAAHYGARSEELLGRWLATRQARAEVTLFHKVGHTPHCRPEAVADELRASLERLRTDHVDVLVLHRDDRSVPVDEFVDALDEEVRAGRTRAVGVSNWASDRAEAFDRYAALAGRSRLALVSNQLSLAEMVEPVWKGCLRAEERWHVRTQRPLLAWSAAARGFFAGRSDSDEEVRRCWLTEANRQRRTRCSELAGRLGVHPEAVALAWVLGRPFPTIAAVGPIATGGLASALAAARLELDPETTAWLAGDAFSLSARRSEPGSGE